MQIFKKLVYRAYSNVYAGIHKSAAKKLILPAPEISYKTPNLII